MKTCSLVTGCKNKYYAKDGCKRHYMRYYKRLRSGNNELPLAEKISTKNGRWKGGISKYSNHYLMKNRRREKIGMVGNKCESCGIESLRLEAHHLDKTKTNHTIDNLKILCHKCHISIFHKKRKALQV